jgi:hypothetical protein
VASIALPMGCRGPRALPAGRGVTASFDQVASGWGMGRGLPFSSIAT